MAIQDLKEQIVRLPEQPGVYLYYNADQKHWVDPLTVSIAPQAR